MSQSTFETLQNILEQYKNKSYQELYELPSETKLTSEELPEECELMLKKMVNKKGKLDINLVFQNWEPLDIYEQRQEDMFKTMEVELLKMGDKDEAEKTIRELRQNFSLIKPMVHPSNSNLVGGNGFSLMFEMLPDGEVIEDEFTRSQKAENSILEEAPWIGTTGLGTELERDLPKYLRLEYGESILDEDSLKASGMEYLGEFSLSDADYATGEFGSEIQSIHYWSYPGTEIMYAYISIDQDGGLCYGMSSHRLSAL